MKKLFFLMASLFLATVLISACGKKDKTVDPNNSGSNSGYNSGGYSGPKK